MNISEKAHFTENALLFYLKNNDKNAILKKDFNQRRIYVFTFKRWLVGTDRKRKILR